MPEPPEPTAAAPNPERAGAASRLRVRVLDARTERALEGFRLVVEPEERDDASFELVTDASGEAESEQAVERGILRFRHQPEGASAHTSETSSETSTEVWEILEDPALFEPEHATTVLELHARPPWLVVWVEARRADGSVVVGREILLASGTPGGGGLTRWKSWLFATTDDEGLARFPLTDDWRGHPVAAALRDPFEGAVSDTLFVEPPLTPGPWLLRLHPGSRLLVRVLSSDGSPAAGLEVLIRRREPVGTRYERRGTTDEQGEAGFAPLTDGTFTVAVYPDGSFEQLARAEVELEAQAERELVLRLEERPPEEVVVAGRVLQADGTPTAEAMLLVECDGRPLEKVFPEPDGTFEHRESRPCSEVVVHAAASIEDGPIEPETVRVPAGTTGLELRYTGPPELRLAFFELVDADTQVPIPNSLDPAVVLYRQPAEGEPVTARSFFGPDGGVTSVEFHPHPDLRWLVSVPGYREQRGELVVPEDASEPPVIRVELRPGFEREVVVRDASTGLRLSGVVVRDADGRALACTAGDGSAHLSASEWPGPLELTHEGYEPLAWNPNGHWMSFSPQIRLRPER